MVGNEHPPSPGLMTAVIALVALGAWKAVEIVVAWFRWLGTLIGG